MLKKLTTGWMLAIIVLPLASNAAETAPDRSATNLQRRLDLRAPDIGKIFSLAQIDAVLKQALDPALEYVEVEALRLGDLPLQDNSASAAENALRTVLWLFSPSETFAAAVNRPPDATYSHRPEPFLQANYHPSFDQP